MSNDDMRVIIYKILTYLYECMKQGKKPSFDLMKAESQLLHIPQPYWYDVLEEMIDAGYIKGIRRYSNIIESGWEDEGIRITLKGVEFLEEDSAMKRAKDFLGDAFQQAVKAMVLNLAVRF